MPKLRIAHLHEQGQNIIVVPLDSNFGHRTSDDKSAIITELQARALGAGLAGTVIPVWETGGRMHFIAPRPWHAFFQSLSIADVVRNINKELSW
jgi:hypothetical protein